MADGIGNAIGGLMGVAIVAGVAGKVLHDMNKKQRPNKTKKRKKTMWGI